MANIFKKLFGKDKPVKKKPTPKDGNETEGPKEKLMRPGFTDEEAFAMGRIAISIVGDKINLPSAMIKLSREFDGYTVGDFKQMTKMDTTAYIKAITIFAMMRDPLKKSYAAGFFAAIVKACNAENDANTMAQYNKSITDLLKINGMEDIEKAANWYEGFEHGKRKEENN